MSGVGLPKFLGSGTPYDGAVSGKKDINPSKFSLIFFTTLINNYKTNILADTEAITTFINEKILKHPKSYKIIHTKPNFFIWAVGTAPFQVLRKIRITILFAKTKAFIEAYITRKLCTNIILRMYYINFYNMSFNVKRQVIYIEHQNHILTMNIDPDNSVTSISVTSSKSIFIPPYSTRPVPINVPISSIISLIPNRT